MTTNKMHLFWIIYLFLVSSTCFGRCLCPSSRAHDWIYSFWYCLPISWMRWNLSSISSMIPAAAITVDNTRSCKYSHVLLMMGEDITQNMYSWLGINKYSKTRASCMSSFTIILAMHRHTDVKFLTPNKVMLRKKSITRTKKTQTMCNSTTAIFSQNKKNL